MTTIAALTIFLTTEECVSKDLSSRIHFNKNGVNIRTITPHTKPTLV